MSNLCLVGAEQVPLRKASTASSEIRNPWLRAPAVLCRYRRKCKMFEFLTRKFVDWRLRRIALRKLHRLDDRLLADIGTRREDIACFVAHPDC